MQTTDKLSQEYQTELITCDKHQITESNTKEAQYMSSCPKELCELSLPKEMADVYSLKFLHPMYYLGILISLKACPLACTRLSYSCITFFSLLVLTKKKTNIQMRRCYAKSQPPYHSIYRISY